LQGRNAEALADDDMAIRLDPKHPLGYVDRGQTLSNLGDRVAALASIDRAMQLAPGFPPALDLLKKIGTGGKPAAEPSAEAAKRRSSGSFSAALRKSTRRVHPHSITTRRRHRIAVRAAPGQAVELSEVRRAEGDGAF
jgi:predicted Zn-dependent protease